MRLFAQINKVDEAKRLVFGRAADETVDKADESMDYTKSKPHFMKWSEGMIKDTDGKSMGNVRAMHGKVAAGKLTDMQFDDAGRTIDVCAKVVDDNEWQKVLEGVYTGFSIGGSYGDKAVEKMDGKDVTRYVAIPNEISLVDRPCIPTAKFFEVQKADGSLCKVDFKEPISEPEDVSIEGTPEQIDEMAKLMNTHKLNVAGVIDMINKVAAREDVSPKEGEKKYGDVSYADEKNKKYPLDTEDHVRAAASYFGMDKNRSKYSAEDQKTIDAKIAAAEKKLKIGDDSKKADFKFSMRKNLATCGQLANLLSSIDYIAKSCEYESDQEGDDSQIPANLYNWLADGGAILKAMIDEEISEAVTGKESEEESPYMAMAEQAAGLQKLAKADKKEAQSLHDKAVSMGADCSGAAKVEPAADLSKVEPNSMEKLIAEAMAPMQKALSEANEKIAKLEAQPMPSRVTLRAISKAEDSGGGEAALTKVQPIIDSAGEAHEPAALIKSLHQSGGAPMTFDHLR